MFSGGDSSMNANIDWATLAAQWIQMRDVPPPREINVNFQNPSAHTKQKFEEKGESDMEMDDISDSPPPAPPMQLPEMSQWLQQPITGNTNQLSMLPLKEDGQWTSSVMQLSTQQGFAQIPSLLKINVQNPNSMKAIAGNSTIENISAIDASKRKILPAWIREGLEKMEREKQKQTGKQEDTQPALDSVNLQLPTNASMVKTKFVETLESESSGNEDEEGDSELKLTVLEIASEKVTNKDCAASLSSSHMSDTPKVSSNMKLNKDFNLDSSHQIGKSYEHKLTDLMIVVRRILTELLLEVTNAEISNIALETIKAHKSKATSAHVIRKSALSSITGKLGLSAYADYASGESSVSDTEASAESSDNENSDDSVEKIKSEIRTKRRAFAKLSEEIEEHIAATTAREEQKLKHYAQMEQNQQLKEYQLQCNSEYINSSHSDSAVQKSCSIAPSLDVATCGKVFNKDFGETTESKFQHSSGKRQRDRKERITRFSDNTDSKNNAIATAASYLAQLQRNKSSATTQFFNASDTGPNNMYVPSQSNIGIDVKQALQKSTKRMSSSPLTSKSSSSNYSETSNTSSSSKYDHSSSSRQRRKYNLQPQSNSGRYKNSHSHKASAKTEYNRHRQQKCISDSDDNDNGRSRRSRHSKSRRDRQKHKSRSRSRSLHTSNSRRRY